ncbi:hypothetical protein D1007_44149 [Hordeum vulgare]|nr:hypothetical protein D1007_44149 [Hordeum vulgare]
MPPGGGDRQGRGRQGRQRQPRLRRRAPPPPLPRLLRQGLRRVGAAGLDGQQHGGEGRPAQQEPEGVRGHRRRQAAPGGRVRRDRLLRRHTRLRRPRQRRPGRRWPVQRPGRAEGRQRLGGVRRAGQPAPTHGERGPPHGGLRQEWALPGGHGHAFRRAHDRPDALQLLQRAAARVQRHHGHGPGPGHGRRQGGGAGAAVPAGEPGRRAHGRRQPRRVRHGLLPRPAGQPRRPRLRPDAHLRQRHGRARGAERRQRLPVRHPLRRRHGEDGRHPGAHRRRRTDTHQLQGRQLINTCCSASTHVTPPNLYYLFVRLCLQKWNGVIHGTIEFWTRTYIALRVRDVWCARSSFLYLLIGTKEFPKTVRMSFWQSVCLL